MAARIDRPGAVILVTLLCLPSLAAAIPGVEAVEGPLNGTNATVEETTTAVETTGIGDTVTASDATTRTTQDTVSYSISEATPVTETTVTDGVTTTEVSSGVGDSTDGATDTVDDATDTVTDSVDDTTAETAETVEDTSDATQTLSTDSLDETGNSVEADVNDTSTTDAVDSSFDSGQSTDGASDDLTDATVTIPTGDSSVDATSDTADALGDTTTAPESDGDGGSETTASSVADATTAITGTVDAATVSVADVSDGETASSGIGSDEATKTVSNKSATASGRSDRSGEEKSAAKTGAGENDPETKTTVASGAPAASGEGSAGGTDTRTPPGRSVPTPADTAKLAGSVLAVGFASHLPDVTALTVNAGRTTGVTPVAAGRGGGRFWRIVTPFRYSQYDDSDPLEHEVRADLFERIERSPGTYLSELDAGMEVSLSTIRHHLRVLEREGMVTDAKVRGKRRFYSDGESVHALAAALADRPTAAVLDAVARREPASVGELADELERDPSTVTYHLKRLEKDGLVERERDGRAVVSRLSPEAKTAFSGRNVVSTDD